MTAEEKKRKKKKQSSVLEAELFRIMEKSLKAAMDKALDDIFRDWKYSKAEAVLKRATSAFFRFLPPDGKWFPCRSQPTKPSSGLKMPFSGSDAHAKPGTASFVPVFPEYSPRPSVQKNK